MSVPNYIPGNHWVTCDQCGKWIRRSEARKQWDGLLVCPEDWDPKHPLLSLRATPDRQAVFDARPEPPDKFVTIKHDVGSFCLISPNGTYYIVYAGDDGVWLVDQGLLGTPVEYFHLGDYLFGVEDDGAIVPRGQKAGGLINWRMVTYPSKYLYMYNADSDGAIIPTYVGLIGSDLVDIGDPQPVSFEVNYNAPDIFVKACFGAFCLKSPSGYYFTVYVTDDGAWKVKRGRLVETLITSLHLGGYRYSVADDGAIIPAISTPDGLTDYCMLSPSGNLFAFNSDPDGAIIPKPLPRLPFGGKVPFIGGNIGVGPIDAIEQISLDDMLRLDEI